MQHRNWYCRVKLPKADRYKTVSLKTEDINAARSLALDQDGEVRYAVKIGHPVFNRPFRQVAKEFLAEQRARSDRGEISKERPKKLKAVIEGPLEDYIGSTQVTLIGDERWTGYPAWRRVNGEGRADRNGKREVTPELAAKLVAKDRAAREKARIARKLAPPISQRKRRKGDLLDETALAEIAQAEKDKVNEPVRFISDSTIRFEMSIFGAVMNFAIKKRYAPASQRFDTKPKLKVMRRDEFTDEEYTKLHTFGRLKWLKGKEDHEEGDEEKPPKHLSDNTIWYRTVAYNFVLIMCNTGMRPSEAKNLRWRDITPAKDRDGRDIVVLFVQGKGKSRKLVAPASVGKYLERIRERSKATKPDNPVFTTSNGKPAKSLYKNLIDHLLTKAKLRIGPCGTIRSTYSFRHTYATYRLSKGVDVYFLAEQMGTSVKMIENHYGHVNTIQHADRVLQGIGGWDPIEPEEDKKQAEANAKASKAAATRDQAARPAQPSRRRAQGQRPKKR